LILVSVPTSKHRKDGSRARLPLDPRDTTVAAAMLDRLLHRSVVIDLDADSYRLRDHHARNQVNSAAS